MNNLQLGGSPYLGFQIRNFGTHWPVLLVCLFIILKDIRKLYDYSDMNVARKCQYNNCTSHKSILLFVVQPIDLSFITQACGENCLDQWGTTYQMPPKRKEFLLLCWKWRISDRVIPPCMVQWYIKMSRMYREKDSNMQRKGLWKLHNSGGRGLPSYQGHWQKIPQINIKLHGSYTCNMNIWFIYPLIMHVIHVRQFWSRQFLVILNQTIQIYVIYGSYNNLYLHNFACIFRIWCLTVCPKLSTMTKYQWLRLGCVLRFL